MPTQEVQAEENNEKTDKISNTEMEKTEINTESETSIDFKGFQWVQKKI